MNSPADTVAQVASDLRELLSGDTVAGLSDADRAALLVGLGEVSRLADAGIVEAVATADVEFGHRFGCRGMNELLRRATLVDAPTAGRIIRAADAAAREVSLVSGERMPARWPAMREALLDGAVGVTGLLAAVGPLERARDRISLEERLWADANLAAFARGENLPDVDADADADTGAAVEAGAGQDVDAGEGRPDAGVEDDTAAGTDGDAPGRGPRASAEDLKMFASALAVGLDPDGAEPSDQEAQARRCFTVGRLRNGVHPVRGNLTPEVAAAWQLIADAYNNPKVGGAPAPGVRFEPAEDEFDTDPDGPDPDGGEGEDRFNIDPRNLIDSRTPGQKRHDALAAVLGIAARHEEMPSLGGAAPTLVVHVEAKDLATGTGWATIPGADTPVSLGVATHTACTGAVQRVLFDEGRIIGISTTDRVFTVHQRRAIVARDRECLIPGCHVPASWCEIHHVHEHAKGGPTHTDNGVPLCWWHHRSLEHSGWEIRMNGGVPQIRGPEWWDPQQRWRTPRHSLPLKSARRPVLRT
ncbi:HNH endonuclease signature motif containing protein [Microbacterium hydrocarbonoxydans]|uniref:HNH endonuclease signature motif containing protein n=1 Tax=Microbacterium hydrocarbonoxydans TaxID=273678 RepID=UPI0013D9ABCF|nr:HNH endonuclease signature motif containing protein [Microbacterium hydrocarbonoxydans]